MFCSPSRRILTAGRPSRRADAELMRRVLASRPIRHVASAILDATLRGPCAGGWVFPLVAVACMKTRPRKLVPGRPPATRLACVGSSLHVLADGHEDAGIRQKRREPRPSVARLVL